MIAGALETPMRPVRTLRTGLAAAVVAWKLAALALLPAALCCRAVMAAEGTAAPACCAGDGHGASCPMQRGRAAETDAAPERPRIAGCGSLDDALVGLLGLTGFTPDACEWTAGPLRVERVTEPRYAAASFAGVPPAPPPRA